MGARPQSPKDFLFGGGGFPSVFYTEVETKE